MNIKAFYEEDKALLADYIQNSILRIMFNSEEDEFVDIKLEGCEGYQVNRRGVIRRTKTKRERKLEKINSGYLRVNIHKKHIRVHRIVASTFIKKTNPAYCEVNHIDGDRTNNNVTNLQWCNSKFNNNENKYKDNAPVLQFFNKDFVRYFKTLKDVELDDMDKEKVKQCCLGKIKEYESFEWYYLKDIKMFNGDIEFNKNIPLESMYYTDEYFELYKNIELIKLYDILNYYKASDDLIFRATELTADSIKILREKVNKEEEDIKEQYIKKYNLKEKALAEEKALKEKKALTDEEVDTIVKEWYMKGKLTNIEIQDAIEKFKKTKKITYEEVEAIKLKWIETKFKVVNGVISKETSEILKMIQKTWTKKAMANREIVLTNEEIEVIINNL